VLQNVIFFLFKKKFQVKTNDQIRNKKKKFYVIIKDYGVGTKESFLLLA